jgi:hypothetical protein
MKRMMVAIVLCVALGVGWTLMADDGGDMAIEIAVSPNTLVMGSQGVWVTVHADIPYSTVAGVSVTLNGVAVDFTKADNRGDLVAKFQIDAIKGIVAPPSAELTLSGLTKDGVAFSGTDTIRVIGATGK